MTKGRFTQHPLGIIQGIWKTLFLLLFPTLRALLALRFDIYTWISGAWFDILVIMAILVYAYLRYRSKYMVFENNELLFIRGILFKRTSRLTPDKIATVYFSNNPLFKLFGAVRVIIETNGGAPRTPEFYITLSKRQASDFSVRITANQRLSPKKSFKPKLHFLIFYSIQSTSTLSGILLLSLLFSQGGAILGRQLREDFLNTVSDLSRRVVLGIPPAAVTISVILLAGWTAGFFYNLIRYLKFRITRKGKLLIIDKGIFVRQKYYADTSKIISVTRKQSMLTKFLGISSVFLSCAGYGKGKSESSVIFPAVGNSEADRTLDMILPEFRFGKINIRPDGNALFSYIAFPLFICGVNILLLSILKKSGSGMIELLRFLIIISLIPCIWFTLVRAAASRLCGIGISGGDITISCVKGFSFRKVSCKKASIVKVRISQNPLGRISKKCKLQIYCAGENAGKHVILGFGKSQAEEIIKKIA